MATAMISGLLNKNYPPAIIRVIESDSKKRLDLKTKFNISSDAEFKKIDKDEIIVLAVKPQQTESLLKSISHEISKQMILSIAAGIQIKSIEKWTNGHKNIVRSMPNMCAQIQEAVLLMYFISFMHSLKQVSN